MSSWLLDPKTGDYVMKDGKPIRTDDLRVPAYYRIAIPRGQWLYAPNTKYGSDLYTLKKKTGNQAIQMVNKAIAPIVEDGRAVSADAQFDHTTLTSRNQAALSVKIVDALGAPQVLQLPTIGE